jgi:hypothetical protein
MTVIEVSGATPDASASNAGTSAMPATGTATTRQSGDLAIGCLGWNSTPVTGSPQTMGYTPLTREAATVSGSQVQEQAAYAIVPLAGVATYSATLYPPPPAAAVPLSSTWTGIIVTLA